MYKYFLLYYIQDFNDVIGELHDTQISLYYPITNITIRKVEAMLKKTLQVKKVTVVNYKKIN